MIVRAILDLPEYLRNFDYFNDGDDTAGWLRGIAETPTVRIGLRYRAAMIADRIEHVIQIHVNLMKHEREEDFAFFKQWLRYS